MERDGSPVVAGQAAPEELAAELRAVAKALRPAQRLQPCLAMSHCVRWVPSLRSPQKGIHDTFATKHAGDLSHHDATLHENITRSVRGPKAHQSE